MFNNDKEIVLEVAKNFQSLFLLLYASKELKNDKEVILEAVKRGGFTLDFASEELRNDPRFVCECISFSRSATRQIGDRLCETSLFVRMMKENHNRDGEYETLIDEFEQEELRTRYKRNEIDDIYLEFVYRQMKREDYVEDSRLRKTGVELQEKLKERNLSLGQVTEMPQSPIDDEKYLERLKSEIFDSDRDLFEKVKKWRMEVKWVSFSRFFFFIDPGPLHRECGSQKGNNFQSSRSLLLRKGLTEKDVCFTDLEFFRVLGRGAYGSTYLCKINGFPGLFVVKFYKRQFMVSEEKGNLDLEKDSIYLEDHPNVVPILFHKMKEEIDLSKLPDYENFWGKIIGSGSPVQKGGMVVMKYHQISLQKWLNYRMITQMKFNGNVFILSPNDLGLIIPKILSGVQHLHKNFIVHRDLHPGNIFVHPWKNRVLIGDFGCCLDLRNNPTKFKVHKKHEILFSVSGSYLNFNKIGGASKYCSPEILNYNSSKDGKYLDYSRSDVYSVGVLAKEMFDILEKKYFDQKNKRGDYWPYWKEFLDFVNSMLKDFVPSLIDLVPEDDLNMLNQRISVESAVKCIKRFDNERKFFVKKAKRWNNNWTLLYSEEKEFSDSTSSSEDFDEDFDDEEEEGEEEIEENERENVFHWSFICNKCKCSPIIGTRYRSVTRRDFDLCEECFKKHGVNRDSFDVFKKEKPKILDHTYIAEKKVLKYKYQHQINLLKQMGFLESQRNKILLDKHQGDLRLTVKDLKGFKK